MNIKGKILLGLNAIAVLLTAYTVYDNNRIVVKEQIVYIENLPREFDGFRILQLSDLHGKHFGKEQAYLISKVNSTEYDMIAFTGDMEGSNNDFTAFIELLKGIKNKDLMFYVNGNDDLAYSSISGNVFEQGKEFKENGCILLTKPYPVNRSGKTLWISNFFKETEVSSNIKGNGEIKIAVTHIPLTRLDFDNLDMGDILDYSLIIAGHYHGGQIRIPFFGALFTPGTRNEIGIVFPDQKDVWGLTEHNIIQQYISAGLGSSIVPFRLFDTPEINLIILKKK